MRRVLWGALCALPAAATGALALGGSGSGATPGLGRYLLAYQADGVQRLAGSADGVRFADVAGFAPRPGSSPTVVRRGERLYVFDRLKPSTAGLDGSLRRFRVSGRTLTELPAATFKLELTSPEDAQQASTIAGTVAIDADGALVALYALRFEPDANACPAAGQACVKLRTATEVAGSDGADFDGDSGNRAVLGFEPDESVGEPSAFAGPKGFLVVFSGPGECLHVLAAADLHGAYRQAQGLPGGCAVQDVAIATPSGTFRSALGEFWLYGVREGAVVRTVTRKLGSPVAARRLRPLAAPGSGSVKSARLALNSP